MPISSIIGKIFKIADAIKKQVDLVKANKERCNRLLERINLILPFLKGLELITDNQKYEPSLNYLNNCLEKALDFVSSFVGKNWLKRICKARSYNKQLDDINVSLQEACTQLNLSINVQQIFNREEDNKDAEKDTNDILDKQNEIADLAVKELGEMQQLKCDQEKRDEILNRQINSMKKLLIEQCTPISKIDSNEILRLYYNIPFCEIAINELIGQGNCGDICSGNWKDQKVIVKTIKGTFSDDEYALLIREAKILSLLKHSSITSFYGAVLDKQNPCVVLEYLERGLLSDVLKNTPLDFATKKQIALDVAEGLQYLHAKNIIHGDLRCETVGLDKNWHAKLTDFGLSNTLINTIATIKLSKYKSQFLAPELFLRDGRPMEATDTYNYGLFMFELFTDRKIPLQDMLQVMSEQPGLKNLNLPIEYMNIIAKCVNKNPEERPKLIDVIKQIEAYTPLKIQSPEEKLAVAIESQHFDFPKAYNLCDEAAQSGNIKAKSTLASWILTKKENILQDKSKAYTLLLEAAQQKDSKAQYNLAQMLEYGDGVTKDLNKALFWYQEAGKNGDLDAAIKITKVKLKLAKEKDTEEKLPQAEAPTNENKVANFQLQ
jgi:tRNA A-37 threonylcarbamoyl transferase component Bud32